MYSFLDFPDEYDFLIDFDNTFIFTDRANNLAYEKAMKLNTGVYRFSYRDIIKFSSHGRITRDTINKFIKNLNISNILSQVDELIIKKEECYSEFIFTTEININMKKLLQNRFLNKIKHRSILVTHANINRVNEIFHYYSEVNGIKEDLRTLFDEVISVSDKNKYEYVIMHLGLKKERVIIYENDPSQIEDAIRFGVPKENIFHVQFYEEE